MSRSSREFTPPQAVKIEMTDELRKKFMDVSTTFIDECRKQGLSNVHALACLSMIQSSYGKAVGGYHGTISDYEDNLRTALEESVKLQSHYAGLLNDFDGGVRQGFANADAWLQRLRETGKIK